MVNALNGQSSKQREQPLQFARLTFASGTFASGGSHGRAASSTKPPMTATQSGMRLD